MKKSLLFASMLAMCTSSFALTTDNQEYPVVDGIETKSMWIASRFKNADDFNKYPFANTNYARTACIAPVVENGQTVEKIFVAWEDLNDEGQGALGRITIVNFYTGALEKTIVPTVDGTPIEGLLCVNQIGCDNFGHIWLAGYVASPFNADSGKYNPVKVYTLDNIETGACTLRMELTLPPEEKGCTGRLDYYSASGDITREEAACVFMATPSDSKKPTVYGWRAEQGSDEFYGIMEDGSFVAAEFDETYPADAANWGTAPTSTIIADDDFTGEYFYVDGFVTFPTLYTSAPMMVESFASATELQPESAGTNGVSEFSINGDNFIFYSLEQYDKGATCRARVCKLGENSSFEGMTKIADIPANGLGDMSDGGNRYHGVVSKVYTDKNGVEGAYLLTYKGKNGIGVYTVAPEGWENPMAELGAVNDIVADQDVNAPVEYFNLNGVAVDADNLNTGLYIKRQGSSVSKVVVK